MSPNRKASVLVVEGESAPALDVVTTLATLGYPVAGVADRGREAIRMARESHPALVLMDLHLAGDLDGLRASRQIREKLGIPIVYLTSSGEDIANNRAHIAHPFGYLLTPFGERELDVAIQFALYRQGIVEAEHERAAAERSARAAVESAHRRAKLLADVSLGLAQAFGQSARVRLRWMAERIVPELCDWCLIDGPNQDENDNQVVRLALCHPVTAPADLLGRLSPPGRDDAKAPLLRPGRVLRDGRAALCRADEPDRDAGDSRNQTFQNLLRELGAHSLISAPLIARGRLLGSITLARQSHEHPFGADDLDYVWQIAERCAISLDSTRLYREAQEAIRVRDEFLSIASHELKTPLTPLQLQIHTLERRARELGRDEHERVWLEKRLATIRRQGERLNRLVGELLEISRIMGGNLRLELERVDLAEVARGVVQDFADRPDLPVSEVLLDLPEGIVGRWDRVRVRQVITNLLGNALKYGQSEPVRITARLVGGQALVTVEDRGIGIAPEDQERVFGRFERAVSSHHYGGFGLGLYIGRQLVEAMGGTISVRSEPHRGSAFTVSLPLRGPATATPTPTWATRRVSPQPTQTT